MEEWVRISMGQNNEVAEHITQQVHAASVLDDRSVIVD